MLREPNVHQPYLIHGLPYWRVCLQDYVVDTVLGRKYLDQRGIRILDLGCGLGYSLTRFSRLLPSGSEAIGIDIEAAAIKKAAALVERVGDPSKAKVHCINAESTPFSDRYFDIIVANLSFSVFKNASIVASEIARILKPGGRLVVSEVNSRSILGKMGELFDTLTGHLYYMLYSPKDLADLFIPLGLQVDNISRIPLAIKMRNRCFKIPSNISPAFHIEFSKPHLLYQDRRVN